ncbi:MAG: hypothetical protein L0Y56_02110 [Nitrospira sp.]|nr:hypothetical protein [Nitrospira sp.]
MKSSSGRPVYFLAFMISFMVCLSGCTPHFKLKSLRADLVELKSQRLSSTDLAGYKDLRGVIHVHSYISHDSQGTREEIIHAAKQTRLNFIIMTDHDTPSIFTEGMQGWYEDVLVIRGMEMIKGCHGSADRCASLLGIGLKSYFDHRSLTFQQVLDEVRRQGGLAFVAHPRGWQDWSLEGITGVEIYDILDDVMDKKWKFPKLFFDVLYSYGRYPEEVFISIQDHPSWHLRKWDQLSQSQRVVGIAGNDAHQNVKVMGYQLDPYPLSFKFVTTHVMAPELNEDSILSALKSGHAYISFDLLSDATGFLFTVLGGGTSGILGDEIKFIEEQVLTVQVPTPGLIVLVKDGHRFRQCLCSRFSVPAAGPGVYRVEVFLKIQDRWRPWILSNSIYLR